MGATFTAFGFTLQGGPVGFSPTATTWNSLLSQLNGNWTIAMYDAGAPDVGNLYNWELQITYTTGVPTSPATWSPIAAYSWTKQQQIPYTGDQGILWTKPVASTTYNVTVNGELARCNTNLLIHWFNFYRWRKSRSPYPANITISGVPTTGVKLNLLLWKDWAIHGLMISMWYCSHQQVQMLPWCLTWEALISLTMWPIHGWCRCSKWVIAAGNPTGTYRPTNNGAARYLSCSGSWRY